MTNLLKLLYVLEKIVGCRRLIKQTLETGSNNYSSLMQCFEKKILTCNLDESQIETLVVLL